MGTVCCNCGVYHSEIRCSLCGKAKPPLGIPHVNAISALQEVARQNMGFHHRNAEANEKLTGLAALEGVTWDDLKDIKPIFDYGRLSPLEKVLFNDVYTWVGANTGGAVTTEVE